MIPPDNGRKLIAIEIKSSHTVSAADFKPIRNFIDQQANKVLRGIIMYAGDKALPFGEHEGVVLWAIPLGMLAGLI